MSGGERISLAAAESVARELVEQLADVCREIVVAGSIRRQRATIGDLDLVCMPIVADQLDMFGMPATTRDLLGERLDAMLRADEIEQRLDANGRASWGPSLKRAVWRGFPVDIRAVHDADTWGAWLLIATGPAAFNKSLVTPRRQGGALPAGVEWKDGFQVWKWGVRVPTPTERDVFDALGLAYREPWERHS